MIPEELKSLAQWTYSFSADEIKRPTHTKYLPNGALTYHQVKSFQTNGTSIGLYTTKSDPYILGDIDHVNVQDPFGELPPELIQLLTGFPTYCEVSPSGEGIRFIYKLASASEKEEVDGSYFLIKEGWNKKESQINFGPPWQRITGNALPFSTDEIATVSISDLERVYNVTHAGASIVTQQIRPTATLDEVSRYLMLIPTDQNPRVCRAYQKVFQHEYQHYEFWVRVMMALHNYAELTGTMVECLSLAIKWSATDPVAYTGEKDVAQHWRSLSNHRREVISYRTLFKIANYCYLKWPVPREQSKKARERGDLPKPLNSEIVNFRYLLQYYDVKIYSDVGNPNIFYLTGDADVTTVHLSAFGQEHLYDAYYGPFDLEVLTSAFLSWCQQAGFTGITRQQVRSHILIECHSSKLQLDPVKYYFDQPFDKLPERYQEKAPYYHKSTFEDLWACLEIDYMTHDHAKEEWLYETYYKVWLYGLVRTLDYPSDPTINNCVLLLTGREQIRKTSHFRYLLPTFMRERYISFTTHGFARENDLRDVAKISATSRLLVWDELEQYLDAATESNFKKLIDNTPQTIIDKYETIPRTIQPVSIYGATSNLREFKLGSEGSRRLFHIPVRWVDTDAMANICWHKLINDLRTEAKGRIKKGEIPWLLTEEQLTYQRDLHGMIRSRNNIDIMLEEVFDFDHDIVTKHGVLHGVQSIQTDRSGRLQNTKEVIETLGRLGYPVHTISRAAVIKSLQRLCGNYSKSAARTIVLHQPKGSLYRGEVEQSGKKKWLLPPMHEGVCVGSRFRDI